MPNNHRDSFASSHGSHTQSYLTSEEKCRPVSKLEDIRFPKSHAEISGVVWMTQNVRIYSTPKVLI